MKVTYIDNYSISIKELPEGEYFYKRLTPGDVVATKVVDNGEYEMYYQATNVEGVYVFGCKQLKDSWEHKAGYVWSSRAGCVNKDFGTKLVGCSYNNTYCAIDANVALPLVEEFYGCPCIIKEVENSEDDIVYRIVKKEG